MIKQLMTALCLCAASALPVAAQDRIEMPITGEILHGWVLPDGTRMAAIKMTLAPGWKTYWHSPGDMGIPPAFDWSRSRNLGSVGFTWPAPTVFREDGIVTIGYKNELILPMQLAPRNPAKPLKLNTTLNIGVCSDICIPHQMKLKTVINDANIKPSPQIAAALAARPFTAQEAGVGSATCSVRPTSDGLEITAKVNLAKTGAREVVVIQPGLPDIWMSETDVTRSGKTLTAIGDMAAMNGAAIALDRSRVKITVIGEQNVVEIVGCAPA